MRAVLTVIGKDTVGILSKVSAVCANHDANITEVTQSVLQDMFAMIMMIDIQRLNVSFADFSDEMAELGKGLNLSIHVMHEDIFNSMHRI